MTVDWPLLSFICAFGYLAGSFPAGVLIARWAGVDDIRAYGSGSTGATNVHRILGLKHGVTVLVLDVMKGVIPAYVGLKHLGLGNVGALAAGLCAVAGHNWSVFLGFKGGKGVATTAGVAAVAFPQILVLSVFVFIVVVAASRYVSLGSLMGIWAGFGYSLFPKFPLLDKLMIFVLATAVSYTHRSNIQRLCKGTERKLGQKGAS